MRVLMMVLVGLVACAVGAEDTDGADPEPADVGLEWRQIECGGEGYAGFDVSGTFPLIKSCTDANGGYCQNPELVVMKTDTVSASCIPVMGASRSWFEVAWLQ